MSTELLAGLGTAWAGGTLGALLAWIMWAAFGRIVDGQWEWQPEFLWMGLAWFTVLGAILLIGGLA